MKSLSLTLLMLLTACAHLPVIESVDRDHQPRIEADCQSHFLKGRWQLVHTIDASLPRGRQAVFTGVIVMSAADASIHCVLMTLEGFVIFEAVDRGQVSVKRAVGPFDNEHFAMGVMEDLKFMFLKPAGDIIAAGSFNDGDVGCRWRTVRNRIVDVVRLKDGGWRMQQYDRGGHLLRTLTAEAIDPRGVAHRLTLVAAGRHGYRLVMRLIEAIRLE
jgi:uncharacterized protein YodC (DUF2158 family)